VVDTPRDALPQEPSRKSGRIYVILMFVLAAVEFGIAAKYDMSGDWLVIAVINIMPVAGVVWAARTRSLDLNKWMESATEMVKAKYGAGQ